MLMMRVAVLGVTQRQLTLSLALPPGFEVDDIDGSTLLLNELIPAESWRADPKEGRAKDLFRGFRATFSRQALEALSSRGSSQGLRVTGLLRDGGRISGACQMPEGLLAARSGQWGEAPAPGARPEEKDL